MARSIQELEELRLLAARCVVEYGPRYGFVLERMEKILARARGDDVTARALRLLSEAGVETISDASQRNRKKLSPGSVRAPSS